MAAAESSVRVMAVVFFISVQGWNRAPAARPGAVPGPACVEVSGRDPRSGSWTEIYEGSPQMVAGQRDHTETRGGARWVSGSGCGQTEWSHPEDQRTRERNAVHR